MKIKGSCLANTTTTSDFLSLVEVYIAPFYASKSPDIQEGFSVGNGRLHYCSCCSISGAFWREGVRVWEQFLTTTTAVQTDCLTRAFSTCPSCSPSAACIEHSSVAYWFLVITVSVKDAVAAAFTSRCFIAGLPDPRRLYTDTVYNLLQFAWKSTRNLGTAGINT